MDDILKMPYTITNEIRRRAALAGGIIVKPSKNPLKKLDAFKDGELQASFGATGFKDYHIYKRDNGAAYAEQKRKVYKARHEKDRHIKYRNGKLTAGWLADN